MRQLPLILISVLAIWPVSGSAELAEAPAEPPPASLTVKPVLCIVDERTPSCDLNIVITWQAPRPGYYCVLHDQDVAARRCWTESRSGRTSERRELSESIEFRLEQGESGIPVARATIDVLRKDSDDRRRRRRTRYVWDVL